MPKCPSLSAKYPRFASCSKTLPLGNTVEKLTKVNGLSDVVISAIQYIPEKNTLVIGYENGNIDIKVNIPDNIFIKADEKLITQVITNLLSNAIKFSQENKHIKSTKIRKEGPRLNTTCLEILQF